MATSDLAKRIKLVRTLKALSQNSMAARLGVVHSFISEIENGKVNPGLDFVMSLARAYELSADWLLFGREPIFAEKAIAGGTLPMYPLEPKQKDPTQEKIDGLVELGMCLDHLSKKALLRKLCLMANDLSDEDLQRLLKNFSDQKLIEKVRAEEAKKSSA